MGSCAVQCHHGITNSLRRQEDRSRRIACLSFTQVQRRRLFIAPWIRPAARIYTPVVQKMGPPCRRPAPSVLLLGEQAPAEVFLLRPYSLPTPADRRLASAPSLSAPDLVRREPQPPDVDHTSPKLATHTRLSSRHRLEWLLLLLLLLPASVSWCGSWSQSTSAARVHGGADWSVMVAAGRAPACQHDVEYSAEVSGVQCTEQDRHKAGKAQSETERQRSSGTKTKSRSVMGSTRCLARGEICHQQRS